MVRKLSYMLPVSNEMLADRIDLYVALGWPNVCVFGRACFIHTRASEACA